MGEGDKMVQWLLKSNRSLVTRHTARLLNNMEINSKIENKNQEVFDTLIKRKMETSSNASKEELEDFEVYKDEDEQLRFQLKPLI